MPDDLVAALEAANVETPVAAVEEVAPIIAAEPVANTGHPAYQEILQSIPASLHEAILPTLKSWDEGVNKKLADVQSQYEPLKAYQGVDPSNIDAGLQLIQALNSDPQAFYKNLAEYYKFGEESGQGNASQTEVDLSEVDDLSNHPQFKQLQQMQEQIAAQLNQSQQAQATKDAELWLSSKQAEIATDLKDTHKIAELSNQDWNYILTNAKIEAESTNDFDKALDNAKTNYVSFVQRYQPQPAIPVAPNVLPPNGSVPATNFNSSSMTEDQRKVLMAQMLTQALKG